ncbi:MAG: glycosyltransferase family 39 protein, partial [Bacteroidales bacterium]|nr:glycosyltransferase family 39 protein [Bacteroidales bacterium]
MLRKFTSYIENHNWVLYALFLILLVPALLINLGYLPLIFPSDEPRRALVALEMMISDNYITPTLNGEFYYNKPPLYNWIIAGFYQMSGSCSEFALRLPVTIALVLFGITIFLFHRRRFGTIHAFTVAAIFITCGRILFYDSFIGLIDICYSWIVYLNFMVIYLYYDKGNLWKLFIYSYLLTLAGFLMKGLPSVVFQGFTLLAFFTYNKKFRILFNYRHFAGVFVFLLGLVVFYTIYLSYNPGS